MNSSWSYSTKTPNAGQNWRLFVPCDPEIWRMTLKNNKPPLLCHIKLCASFHRHMLIQTGVTVRKRLDCVLTSVTLTFVLWSWPFAWTSPLSVVITHKNFMIIRWRQHSEKGVTDGQTDGRTDWTLHRAAWSQLKVHGASYRFTKSTLKNPVYNTPSYRTISVKEPWLKFHIKVVTVGLLCTRFIFPTRIIWRVVSRAATDCPCCVLCCELCWSSLETSCQTMISL